MEVKQKLVFRDGVHNKNLTQIENQLIRLKENA